MTHEPTRRSVPQKGRTTVGIGAVSKACGVPVETLRTWERRYGFPNPERTPSGHRLYSPPTVARLRLVARVLRLGVRASRALEMAEPELRALIESQGPGPSGATGQPPSEESAPGQSAPGQSAAGWSALGGEGEPPSETDDAAPGQPVEWLDAVRSLDGEALDRLLEREARRQGVIALMEASIGPFLVAVGELWAAGEITVAQEHFASERVRGFLANYWQALARGAAGPVVVCTTLPGEQHHLALHMAASALALAGCRIVFLGTSTPLVDVARTATSVGARAVAVSVSSAMDPAVSSRSLRALADSLPAGCELLCGGAGALLADERPAGRSLGGLRDLVGWAERAAREASEASGPRQGTTG